jgi:hypothetical protein
MVDPRLTQQLEKVAARIRRLRFWRGLTLAWMMAATVGLAMLALNRALPWHPPAATGVVCVVALLIAAFSTWLAHTSSRNYHRVAQRVEAAYPELKSCLLAAIEQQPALPGGRYGFLQDRVVRQALNHAYGHTWQQVVPTRRIVAAMGANLAVLLLLLFVLAGLNSPAVIRQAAASPGDLRPASTGQISVTIEPGDTEVERGTSLLVLARVQGPPPAEATLAYQSAAGEPARLLMAKSLDDPVFGGRISVVDAPLEYHVELGGSVAGAEAVRSPGGSSPGHRLGSAPATDVLAGPEFVSESYHVSVFEFPKLVRVDARLVYPEYTALDERLVQDVRTVSAVEGTELKLLCYINKPVASATLVEEGSPPLALAASDKEPLAWQVSLRCDKSRRLRLHLVDEEGRKNKNPDEITINVLPNKPPDLKLAFPAHDVEVSPLEETDVRATAWDDFGLRRFGLSYALAGADPTEVVLGENAAAKARHDLEHVIRFEDLEAEPDQLLSYHFWAEDTGPNGQTRRTESDMYFAEVRPFDEIFRQGQPPPGGSRQQQQQGAENAQAAEKLAKLQKDIINATWNVLRRELPAKPSDGFNSDVQSIRESQSSALQQAEAVAEKLDDAQSKAHAAEVTQSMRQALDELQAALDGKAVEPLRPALAAEKAAYQALLKLRAREHSVVRGQQQGGGGGGSGRSQQQLQQLELSNDENRYETQRTAQSQQPLQQRETRQVLNRLSELARRQSDLNERLKELQSALEEANSEPDREEIRRQLKRLREEEQEILRDTDELKSRMDQPENQERMADARQQLNQTRDQVRRASEALEQEKVSQAAAAGTRAERDFQELRNDFRRRASGQFTDQMREMRDDAQKLDEKEKELAQRLAGDAKEAPQKSLRDDQKLEELPAELAGQKQRLAELLDRMRETIEQAEPTEPLLAEQLYDTSRKVQEHGLDRALDAAELSMRHGLADDARGQERIAGKGISELRQGIERAAESVLGDDTEALRRAREELDRLADELGDEIARNTNDERPSPGTAAVEKSPGGSLPRPSETKDGQRDGQNDGLGRPPHDEDGGRQPAGQPDGKQQGSQGGGKPTGSSTVDGFAPFFEPGAAPRSPLAGEDFREWSDRLRDVEEMVEDAELRAEAARIRQRAQGLRAEMKRHSKSPNWDLIKIDLSRPLYELRDRVAEELLRRTSKDAVLPLDRDPVPPKYSEKTRRYYERLGSGR